MSGKPTVPRLAFVVGAASTWRVWRSQPSCADAMSCSRPPAPQCSTTASRAQPHGGSPKNDVARGSATPAPSSARARGIHARSRGGTGATASGAWPSRPTPGARGHAIGRSAAATSNHAQSSGAIRELFSASRASRAHSEGGARASVMRAGRSATAPPRERTSTLYAAVSRVLIASATKVRSCCKSLCTAELSVEFAWRCAGAAGAFDDLSLAARFGGFAPSKLP